MTYLCIIRVARSEAAHTNWPAFVHLDRIGNNDGDKVAPHAPLSTVMDRVGAVPQRTSAWSCPTWGPWMNVSQQVDIKTQTRLWLQWAMVGNCEL
jgi:hypothetical protein